MIKSLVVPGLLAAALFMTQSAQAAGIGIYGTGGVNFSTWRFRNDPQSYTSTDYFYGGGLIIDSNVARNELFNYRFTTGYEQYRIIQNEMKGSPNPRHRFSMTHTFGFGVARNEYVRFWVGPRIGMHYMYLRDSYTNDSLSMEMGYLGFNRNKVREKIDVIGLDALLALGLNINMGNVATLFFDIGVGYMGNYNIHVQENSHGFGVEGKIGFMFRINDTYKAAESAGDIKMQVKEIEQNTR
jgi:opacity protein-like surface antigen